MSINWQQLGLDIDGEALGEQSGYSVSLSSDGNTVAIGAPYNGGEFGNGCVRIYKYLNNVWTQLGANIDSSQWAGLGNSVSLSSDGNTVAIGAPYNGGELGTVRIYTYLNNVWTQLGSDIDGEASNVQSGYAVSLSSDGTIVAIGAPYNSSYKGHVRIYKYLNNVWTQLGEDIDGEASNDQSGFSVSLSSDGTIVAIGAVGIDQNGNNSGHVRIYKYLNNVWTQLGSDIDGEASNNNSGFSVSLSSDGTIVAIGAIGNDQNGSYSGHVRIYKYLNNVWTQLGSDIDGEASGDQSGHSVSLNSDGTTVAIGANGNNQFKGHVRIYKYLTPTIPICFPAGTPVETDQGEIAIEKINCKKHTIKGKKIVAITKTITMEDSIVCIEKDALGINIPSQKTLISRNHKLLYNKEMIKAKHLVKQVEGVYNKKYNGEILYNVLLETYNTMMINNLNVETLDPKNIIAQLYNGSLTEKRRNNIIKTIASCCK